MHIRIERIKVLINYEINIILKTTQIKIHELVLIAGKYILQKIIEGHFRNMLVI